LHGPAQVTGNVTQGTNGAGTIAMPAIPAAVVPVNCLLEKFFGLILFIGSDVDFSKNSNTLLMGIQNFRFIQAMVSFHLHHIVRFLFLYLHKRNRP
jgi:hypothetical protein